MREAPYTDADVKRFLDKVDKRGTCWLWTACAFDDGYGAFQLSHPLRTVRAHRFSFVVHNKTKITDLQVLHRCDTPLCVRPSHLFLGSHADNMIDRMQKGRQPKEERNGRARLTVEQVHAIRQAARLGRPQIELAQQFEVDAATINHIVRRRTWKHV